MGKTEKLLTKLLKQPPPKDFTWNELVKLLASFGYEQKTGSGSKRKFYKSVQGYAVPINLHEPHPQNTIKTIYIKQIIQALKQNGDIEQ